MHCDDVLQDFFGENVLANDGDFFDLLIDYLLVIRRTLMYQLCLYQNIILIIVNILIVQGDYSLRLIHADNINF